MLVRLLLSLCLLGSLAVPCLAQSENGTAPAANSTAPATPSTSSSTAPAQKKVWTNEDLPAANASAVDKRNQNPRATTTQTADPATIDRIRKNLEKLQSQLDDVEKKIKSYQDFLKGEPVSTGSREIDTGVNRVPVDQQILKLQEKKKNLEAQIGDLFDEARKKNIDPGQLR